uniref:THAP-type domain-containing protein n=1 Tax=Anopheles epiroticus TaxID=199890 RepID=A0A182PWZ5_9DIPT
MFKKLKLNAIPSVIKSQITELKQTVEIRNQTETVSCNVTILQNDDVVQSQIDVHQSQSTTIEKTSDDNITNAKCLSCHQYNIQIEKLTQELSKAHEKSRQILERYARKLNLKEGILEDVLDLLKHITADLQQCDRECVLSFNEMKVNRILEYDPASDEILGPHNNLQVVMARGLFKNWKQPVFIGFDQQMTKNIILEIIKRLHETNINVVAIVSDNCQANVGCWKDLGTHNYDHPFFKHPINDCNIYVFPDAPHLLKLIRNWLLDKGFEYHNKIIKADKLFDLVANRNAVELTPIHKLSQHHLVMTPQERQNVRKAAEILSRTTAIALRRYYPEDRDAEELASFIEKVDLWFSVSNSYSPYAKLHFKKSFNANENQMDALNNMFELMSNINALGKTSMQVFQKSVLMHITSLRLLYDDMKQKHNISYISTYKLNQDVLENFFSQLRQIGGVHDHPSPLNYMYRIRMMILAMQEINNISQASDRDSEDSNAISSDSNNNLTQSEQESDGLQYVLGYIAYKYNSKFPELNLGTQTFQIRGDHSYIQPPTFVQHLS